MNRSRENITPVDIRVCVLIPTYNNERTLEDVIAGCVEQPVEKVFVVDDGSTDRTEKILDRWKEEVHIIQHTKNRGKGAALRNGFLKAYEEGFDQAITIDSDGQHDPSDIPAFLKAIRMKPEFLYIGARNMDQKSVPGGSSFGNRFSNFWFRLETGIKLPDTQSGFRAYPLRSLACKRYFSRKFEFEIEVLVRAAWAGVKLRPVPVSVHYPEEGEERITHFRPFKDFLRISVLNTILVPLALLYYRPRMIIRDLSPGRTRAFLRKHFFRRGESNTKKALSVGVGIFMGIVPIWGYQLATAILLAHWLRLNKGIVILAANISIPPMIPVILFLSYWVGGFFLGKGVGSISGLTLDSLWKSWDQHLIQYLIGSVAFAIGLSVCLGLITYLVLSIFRKGRPLS